MKTFTPSWRQSLRTLPCQRLALIVLLLTSSGLIAAVAQTLTPQPGAPPQDAHGLGVQTSGPINPQTEQAPAREIKPELVLQTGYSNFLGATRLVFSPDGRLLATTTLRSSTIKLWETATGRELRDLSGGGQSTPSTSTAVAFSRDSRLLAAAADDNMVKVWNVTTGRELQTFSLPKDSTPSFNGVHFIAFSGDGRTLVTISDVVRTWDLATGNELHTLGVSSLDHSGFTRGEGGAALSADGSRLAAVVNTGPEPEVKVWDLASGREARSVKLRDYQIESAELCFTSDGRLLAAGIVKRKLKVWDLTANGKESDFGSTTRDNSLIKFSRDGRLLALTEGYTVKLWDMATRRELPALSVPNNGLFPEQRGVFMGFSDDGKAVATGGFDTQTILWDSETGKQLVQMKGRTNMAYDVAFSADGTHLSSGGCTSWDLRTGRGLRLMAATSVKLFGVPSPNGRLIAGITPNSSTVRILETTTGHEMQKLAPSHDGGMVQHAGFSPDGRLLVTTYTQRPQSQVSQETVAKDAATATRIYRERQDRLKAESNENQIKIWEVATGRELRTLIPGSAPSKAKFSPDGRVLVTLSEQGEIALWDVASGSRLRDLTISSLGNLGTKGSPTPTPSMADPSSQMTNALGATSSGTMNPNITSLAFSPDGRMLAAGGVESKSNLDQAAMAAEMKSGKTTNSQNDIKNTKVEPIGQIVLWDMASGREIGALKGHGKGVTQVAFSRDGQLLASSSSDNTIKIWDVASRRELRTLVGHTADINSLDFSPDARLVASAGDDGSTYLWDTATGEHLLTLISLDDGGEWVVVTPDGLFDGTPVSWNQILWRYDEDTFNVAPIEWFFNEFYNPGLLSDIFAGKRPHATEGVAKKDRRQPQVKLVLTSEQALPTAAVTSRRVTVKIEVLEAAADKDHQQGSGARDLRLFRNGSLVKVWHGDVLKAQAAVTLEEEIPVLAGANRFTAYAFNKDNVKSKDAQLSLTGAEGLKRAGTAYIIAVGINEYANAQYNLKYAVADAQSFAEEVRRRQSQVGRFERVEVVPLLNGDATKKNLVSALERLAGRAEPPTLKAGMAQVLGGLKRAEPEDAVIIYFAGHGTAQGQRFYLIPHDLGYSGDRTNLNDEGLQTILAHSISDVELEQAVEGMDAGHLLLVIDACNSGQALEADEKRRGPMNSKGLAQLAYEKGMFILTAAQSYQAALEASHLGHGLLTYALVEEGLKTGIADRQPKDGVLSTREWLDFATERVPQMQEEKMKQARGIGLSIAFTEGEQKIADPEKRSVQRPRVFYRRELEADPLIIARSRSSRNAAASSSLPGTTNESSNPVPGGKLSRWFELQTALLNVRYRFIENSQGVTVTNQLQDQVQLKAAFKFDKAGNYRLNAGVFTGNNFTAGLNDTGIGTGRAITNLYLKQLFLSAKPVTGVEAQFGGFYFNRGESTEITTYDNDGYLMGERIVIKRPKHLFFDEISATYAFLGDLLTPNINKRWHDLKKSNYHQFLVRKKIGERAVVSGDYTFLSGSDTLRQAVRVNTPELKAIDLFRVELYQRVAVNPAAGFAASLEKAFLKKRLTLSGGYAQIDRNYVLNADRFNRGRRFFFNGSFNLSPEFTISTFFTRAFRNDFPIANRTRFEVIFSYNLLKSLEKAKLF